MELNRKIWCALGSLLFIGGCANPPREISHKDYIRQTTSFLEKEKAEEIEEIHEVIVGDRAPVFREFDVEGMGIMVRASDVVGSNNGIERINLFDGDGNVLKDYDCRGRAVCEIYYPFYGDEFWQREFYAVAFDKGGNKTISRKVKVRFVE